MDEMVVLDYWKQFEPTSTAWHVVMSVAYSVIAALSLFGNLMVIYFLVK